MEVRYLRRALPPDLGRNRTRDYFVRCRSEQRSFDESALSSRTERHCFVCPGRRSDVAVREVHRPQPSPDIRRRLASALETRPPVRIGPGGCNVGSSDRWMLRVRLRQYALDRDAGRAWDLTRDVWSIAG